MLEQAPFERGIVEMCMRQGRPLPPKLANAPEPMLGLGLFMQAFLELSSCRPLGFGTEGQIPWIAIAEWCVFHDVSGEQREDLAYHVKSLDMVYLKHMAKKRENTSGGQPGRVPSTDARGR